MWLTTEPAWTEADMATITNGKFDVDVNRGNRMRRVETIAFHRAAHRKHRPELAWNWIIPVPNFMKTLICFSFF